MSKSITIRDVPDSTSAELSARAASTGRSLQEYLRAALIELADKPDAEAIVARIRNRKRVAPSSLTNEDILEHRDVDRR